MHLGITSQVTITSKKGCMHPGITSQQNTNSGYHYTTSKIMLSALRHYITGYHYIKKRMYAPRHYITAKHQFRLPLHSKQNNVKCT